jgi:hypothetical protein
LWIYRQREIGTTLRPVGGPAYKIYLYTIYKTYCSILQLSTMLSRIPLLVLMAGVLMLMGTAAAPAQYDASPSESFIVSYKQGQRAAVRKYSATADVYSASVWQKHCVGVLNALLVLAARLCRHWHPCSRLA